MRPEIVFQIAWRGLNRNKFRSLLTMLGVIIGVAAVIIMVSISAGTEAAIAERINRLGTNLIFIQANMPRGMPGAPQRGGLVYDDATAISQRIEGVEGVGCGNGSTQKVQVENKTIEEVSILGTTPDFPTVRDMSLQVGRFF
jgi:putative ABC transport system permease protein